MIVIPLLFFFLNVVIAAWNFWTSAHGGGLEFTIFGAISSAAALYILTVIVRWNG